MISGRHSYATLAAIGALAFIVACVGHEAVGHGSVCLASGAQITLLTSVYFRCSTGSPAVDVAGPVMNLFLGLVCWAVLSGQRKLSILWRLFLVLGMGFNLFWGSGYLMFSALTKSGDLAFVLKDLHSPANWLWPWLMGGAGLFLYLRAVRLVAIYLPRGTPLLVPYLAAGMVSCLAVLAYSGHTLPALIQAAQESFCAFAGLLFLAYRNRITYEPAEFVPRSCAWILSAAVMTAVFVLMLGRGSDPNHQF